MFVSFRLSHIKAALGVFLLGAILFLVTVAFGALGMSERITFSSDEERAMFLSSMGYSAEDETLVPTIIPTVWNDVYEEYNLLQLEQGFDLDDYRGETVQRYICPVGNCREVTLVVFEERLIAADVYDYSTSEMTVLLPQEE